MNGHEIISTVVAQVSNPGIGFSNWLMNNMTPIFAALVAGTALVMFVKKQFIKMGVTILVGAVCALLFFDGVTFLQKLGNTIMSFF